MSPCAVLFVCTCRVICGKQPCQDAKHALYSISYLSKVVKVVFVVNPSIVGSQAVRFIGDILHIETHTVVELSFEKL